MSISNPLVLLIVLFLFLLSLTILQINRSQLKDSQGTISTILSPDIMGWFDAYPTESKEIHYYLNHLPLQNIQSTQIPMFPYENAFYMILIEEGEENSLIYKQEIEPYFRNKLHSVITFTKEITPSLNKATEKAELAGKSCVFVIFTSGKKSIESRVIYRPKFPIFLFNTIYTDKNQKSLIGDLIVASGGKIFPEVSQASFIEMDALILTPVQNQRIVFSLRIPFFRRFFPNTIQVEYGSTIHEFRMGIPEKAFKWVTLCQQIIVFFIILTSLPIIFLLIIRSRKKWKKRKRKEAKKKSLKKFHIGWLLLTFPKSSSIRISKSFFTIGSSEKCDLVLRESSISGHHCQIIENENGFLLLDLKSRIGTFVNNKLIQQQLLEDGDQITIGTMILVFHKSALQYVSDEKVL